MRGRIAAVAAIAVVGSAIAAPGASATKTVSPTSYDFGALPIGTKSVERAFTLTATCNPSTDGSCTVRVTFTPTAFGPRNGTLITGGGGPNVPLSGSGPTLIVTQTTPGPTSTPAPAPAPAPAKKCKKPKKSAGAAAKKCRKGKKKG